MTHIESLEEEVLSGETYGYKFKIIKVSRPDESYYRAKLHYNSETTWYTGAPRGVPSHQDLEWTHPTRPGFITKAEAERADYYGQ